MITVRGPADLLPPGVQMVAGLEGAKMQYIGAIGHSDFSVDAKGQKHNLWFITPMGGEYRVFTKNAVPGESPARWLALAAVAALLSCSSLLCSATNVGAALPLTHTF